MRAHGAYLAWTPVLAVLAALLVRGPGSPGVDAVSAVTPGHVAVVGAATAVADGAPRRTSVEALVQRAVYLAGGLHHAVDAAARSVLVRPARRGPIDRRARRRHLEVVGAVVDLVHEATPRARVRVLVGAMPGSGQAAATAMDTALTAWAAAGDHVEIVDLASAPAEPVAVPDGGEAADRYPVPIALLEADALINVARAEAPFCALRNLEGLAGPPPPGSRARGEATASLGLAGTPAAGWIDRALLAEVAFTVVDWLDRDGPDGPLVLAGADGIAVDRVVLALLAPVPPVPVLDLAQDRWLGVAHLGSVKVNGLLVPGAWGTAPDTTAPGGD